MDGGARTAGDQWIFGRISVEVDMTMMRGLPFSRLFRIFKSDQRGSMTILSLTLLSAAALLGGLAVDVMRFENRRTQMQTALDLCVLNAASLRQTLNETTLFNDCVRKAGMTGTVTKLTVTEGYSSKSVTASASETINTMFLGSLGISSLTVTGVASAMERVGNVEVSLVLDVSGSMAGTRMTNLKTAAKDFVKTLLTDDEDGRVLITVVPYNGQVNLGSYLAAKYTVTNTPFNSNNAPDVRNTFCVDLPASAYSGTSISRTLSLPATTYVDSFSTTAQTGYFAPNNTTNATLNSANLWCPPTASPLLGNVVRLPSLTDPNQQSTVNTPAKRVAALNTYIDSLTAIGATSINAGMRWGLAFLDPSMKQIYNEFISNNQMPQTTKDRPLPFNDPDVLKVIVLMSDGENFAEERVQAGYRSGTPVTTAPAAARSPMSPIWVGTDGNYSIFHTGRADATDHYVPHLNTWRATPYVNASNSGTATNLTWGQVWERVRMSWVAYQLYARPGMMTYANAMNMFRTQTPIADMNTQLQTVCTTARTNNVVVYTIAFEATTTGQTQLRNCATTTSRYYVASTTTISQVFASIAGNISKLKLTQ
ncbi:MAG: hypothetical protein CFE34_01705 [Rhodobacteraceae bacterium PARR1]|nr:MAG: hypothetical protein CFE34_01705 [Rhodobacteraceae bacterium PARR1]